MSEQELNNPDVSTGPDPIVPPQPEPEPVPDDDMASLVVVDGVERTIPGKDDDLDDDMLVDLGDDQEDVEARLKEIQVEIKALRVEAAGLQLHLEKIEKRLAIHTRKSVKSLRDKRGKRREERGG